MGKDDHSNNIKQMGQWSDVGKYRERLEWFSAQRMGNRLEIE